MNIYNVKEVFTPTRPARVAFVDREAVNQKLVNALQMPGKQIIVYGHSGSGKTTLLLNKLNQLYERHITTRCMKGLKFDQLILDAFDQLESFYQSEKETKNSSENTLEIAVSYFALQGKINTSEVSETSRKESRVLPPQLTPQALGKFLGKAKCCWILEDFHKIDESEKIQLSQLMKVFMDLLDDYEELKIVALGAVDTARQVINYDLEMRNRVAEIHVELMSTEEIKSIITKGEQALNVKFGEDLKSLIATYSNGLASVCHHICMYMCNAINLLETQVIQKEFKKSDFEKALNQYAEESSDSIRSAFDKAVKQRRVAKYDSGSLVLEALTTFKERGASRTDLLKRIRYKEDKFPETNLKYLLPKLATTEYGALIRFDRTAGLYSFSDPIFRVFALAHFHKGNQNKNVPIDENDGLYQLYKIFSNEFNKNSKYQIRIEAKQ